jgi:hypothetical protein
MLKYNIDISPDIIVENLKRLTNQIYKLLPDREEGIDWKMPLSTIMIELSGLNRLFLNGNTFLFSLLCKLEGLAQLDGQDKYFLFRKTIFECLNLMGRLIQTCQEKH